MTETDSPEGGTADHAHAAAQAPDVTIAGLTDLLVKAVRALGAAGEPDQASRVAAKAWWVLKDWPRQAERINGTMHYLAKLPQGRESATGD
ncbi:MAG: hypothetical protein BGO26_08165 [Actinobacteria bacterium 69-20]|jgi:hypothetical protein|nr:hypothetical protein [Actinomycetota bacterium]OJV30296.1 MAG: hypothetical protein BGO26_08165 [Actinobacteria bacterium 69-20]